MKKKYVKDGMTLAAFLRSRSKIAHLSAPLEHHPLWLHARHMHALSTYTGPRWFVGKGKTLDVQRNAMKRQRLDLMIKAAGSVRAYRRPRRHVYASAAA